MKDCEHKHIISIGGKVSDSFGIVMNGREVFDIYVPKDAGIGSCDYLEMKICIQCHRIIDFNPEPLLAVLP